MDTTAETKKPEPESLRTQLQELNNRVRRYAQEFWQVPFAYLAIAGVVFSQVLGKLRLKSDLAAWLLILLGLVGVLVVWHMFVLMGGNNRAVKNIRNVEAALGLEQTALFKFRYLLPSLLIPSMVAVVSIFAGICYLLKHARP